MGDRSQPGEMRVCCQQRGEEKGQSTEAQEQQVQRPCGGKKCPGTTEEGRIIKKKKKKTRGSRKKTAERVSLMEDWEFHPES